MYDDLTIRKFADDWYLETPSGNYPVTLKLAGNGWSIPNIWSDGPARLSYELVFNGRDAVYSVDVDYESQSINSVTVEDQRVDYIVIGCNFPVTKLIYITTPDGVMKHGTECLRVQ